jgi:heterodisulfide reductase subunit A2
MNINIVTNTEVTALDGEAGNFTASLKTSPRFIDPEKCTGCGQCAQVCPVVSVNEFNCGLDCKTATCIKYAQAVPLIYTIDRDTCIGCGICETVCLAKAIRYDDVPHTRELNVGAIVLATGDEVFDPSRFDTYHYATLPNVVTSLEFERILSASGPYRGRLMRPYDREEPRKIAWLQCIGSRDLNMSDNAYCSSVCCMYAIKEAVIAKEHARGSLDATIFYMDIRSYGKDFESYYERSREHGVRFIRSRVHSVEPAGDGDVELAYVTESGERRSEVFNMVVLSVGFQTTRETMELAGRLGIELDANRFVKTDSFMPVATTRPGIFVCGSVQGPKDIPQSVMEASAASAAAGVLLKDARWTRTREKEVPPQTNVKGDPPRIGVFVCQCGINIGGVVNVPQVRDYAKTLPHVVYTEDNLYTCSQDTQVKMAAVIREKNINRVVVAACTPRTHEPLFQETLQNAGLNKYLFEMANIRNQCSWVHGNTPLAATEKAKDLVRMAVAKATLLDPLQETELDVNMTSLVVGGGIAGMTAAKTLADQGYEVHLVERSENLGGNAMSLYMTWKGEGIQAFVSKLADEVERNPLVTVHKSTELVGVEGFVGNFTSELRNGSGETATILHGVAILATGARELEPTEYLYGGDPRVMTHLELDSRLIGGDPSLKYVRTAVFIQCVGSREPEHPYCSRVCCTHTIENSIELKKLNPDMAIYVLYRDIRTYGEREDLYTQARKEGVVFIRYDLEDKPKVSASAEGIDVVVTDPILQRPVALRADMLVLATAIAPSANEKLSQFFKVPLNGDGFFVEAHAKLRPVDFATEGVFLCGMAHYPKPIDESISQALAAASRATRLLAKPKVFMSGAVSETVAALCSGCGTCVSICPYSAAGMNGKGKSEINPALCKGCGLCAASCRSGAIRLKGFEDSQILAMIESV